MNGWQAPFWILSTATNGFASTSAEHTLQFIEESRLISSVIFELDVWMKNRSVMTWTNCVFSCLLVLALAGTGVYATGKTGDYKDFIKADVIRLYGGLQDDLEKYNEELIAKTEKNSVDIATLNQVKFKIRILMDCEAFYFTAQVRAHDRPERNDVMQFIREKQTSFFTSLRTKLLPTVQESMQKLPAQGVRITSFFKMLKGFRELLVKLTRDQSAMTNYFNVWIRHEIELVFKTLLTFQGYIQESLDKVTNVESVTAYVYHAQQIQLFIQMKHDYMQEILALKEILTDELLNLVNEYSERFDGRLFSLMWHPFVSNVLLGYIKERTRVSPVERAPHAILKLFEAMRSTTIFFEMYTKGAELAKQENNALFSYTISAWKHFKKMKMTPPMGLVSPRDIAHKKAQIEAFLVPFRTIHGPSEWSRRFEALEKEVQQYLDTFSLHEDEVSPKRSRLSLP